MLTHILNQELMLKNPIQSAIETTLFYYSSDSTTGQVWCQPSFRGFLSEDHLSGDHTLGDHPLGDHPSEPTKKGMLQKHQANKSWQFELLSSYLGLGSIYFLLNSDRVFFHKKKGIAVES